MISHFVTYRARKLRRRLTPSRVEVPRTIYSLWLQGVANAPPLAKLNFERWKRLNPGYRMVILEEADVRAILSDFSFPLDELAPQALSDIVRAFLLSQDGGIWVDATVFPAKPLDEWLPSHLTTQGFFAFERPGVDRPLSTWFLAATAANPIMQAWWKEVADYWAISRTLKEGVPEDPVAAVSSWPDSYPYFWFHYLFQRLLDTNERFSARWADCLKAPAQPSVAMQDRFGQEPPADIEEIVRISGSAPVHKLNWRLPHSIEALHAIE